MRSRSCGQRARRRAAPARSRDPRARPRTGAAGRPAATSTGRTCRRTPGSRSPPCGRAGRLGRLGEQIARRRGQPDRPLAPLPLGDVDGHEPRAERPAVDAAHRDSGPRASTDRSRRPPVPPSTSAPSPGPSGPVARSTSVSAGTSSPTGRPTCASARVARPPRRTPRSPGRTARRDRRTRSRTTRARAGSRAGRRSPRAGPVPSASRPRPR